MQFSMSVIIAYFVIHLNLFLIVVYLWLVRLYCWTWKKKKKKSFNLGSKILGSPPSFHHHLSTSVICLMFKERDLPDVLLDHTTLACRSCPILTAIWLLWELLQLKACLPLDSVGVQIGLWSRLLFYFHNQSIPYNSFHLTYSI